MDTDDIKFLPITPPDLSRDYKGMIIIEVEPEDAEEEPIEGFVMVSYYPQVDPPSLWVYDKGWRNVNRRMSKKSLYGKPHIFATERLALNAVQRQKASTWSDPFGLNKRAKVLPAAALWKDGKVNANAFLPAEWMTW